MGYTRNLLDSGIEFPKFSSPIMIKIPSPIFAPKRNPKEEAYIMSFRGEKDKHWNPPPSGKLQLVLPFVEHLHSQVTIAYSPSFTCENKNLIRNKRIFSL